MNSAQQIARSKKTKIGAETAAFTCLLIYFTVKAFVLLILYKYDNYLTQNISMIIPFILLLLLNTYFMLTTGKNPGFENNQNEEEEIMMINTSEIMQMGSQTNSQKGVCQVCKCKIRNRMKHCYKCGRCVRKYDHHCPWIGACVGEKNHFKFCGLLLMHTLQSSLAFYILLQSMLMYEYRSTDGSFGPEYGVFAFFSLLMLFYIAFAGCLLLFHSFLIASNITTKELMQRGKLIYLKNVRGNPFSKGLLQNLEMAIFPPENGFEWKIDIVEWEAIQKREKTLLQLCWSNKYYSCC